MPRAKKSSKNNEETSSEKREILSEPQATITNERVHAPPGHSKSEYRTCQVCSAAFRVAKKHTSRHYRYCSHACRTQATRLRRIAEENYLKREMEALAEGKTQAEASSIGIKERRKRIREGVALDGGAAAADDYDALALARESKAKSLLERVRSAEPFTPAEAARMQSGIAALVEDQIMQGHRVVMGTLQWSPTQARVFKVFVDKCIPDLSANFTKSENTNINISEMSREQLEAIAAESMKTIEASPTPDELIDKEFEE